MKKFVSSLGKIMNNNILFFNNKIKKINFRFQSILIIIVLINLNIAKGLLIQALKMINKIYLISLMIKSELLKN